MIVARPCTTMPTVSPSMCAALHAAFARRWRSRAALPPVDTVNRPWMNTPSSGATRGSITLVDRGERDVLRSLEVAHDLMCVQAALGLDDRRQMLVRMCVGSGEQRVELVDLTLGLEHRAAR